MDVTYVNRCDQTHTQYSNSLHDDVFNYRFSNLEHGSLFNHHRTWYLNRVDRELESSCIVFYYYRVNMNLPVGGALFINSTTLQCTRKYMYAPYNDLDSDWLRMSAVLHPLGSFLLERCALFLASNKSVNTFYKYFFFKLISVKSFVVLQM